jgi:hypothetical protein
MLQSSFYLTIALHVSGIIITPSSGAQTTITTASGNRYTIATELPAINVIVGVSSEFLSYVPSCVRYTLRSAVSQYFTGGRNVQGIIIPCEWQLRIQTRPICLPLFQNFIIYNDQLVELIAWEITLYFVE